VSAKTAVIEDIFNARAVGGSIPAGHTMVTLQEVQDAINANNAMPGRTQLSARNPANFLKDIVRNETRNSVFPASVAAHGYTALQRPGGGNCFEFVLIPAGQGTPYPVVAPPPTLVASPHSVQSLTLVASGRRYGRDDESWLIAVATALGLIQTHLALNNSWNLVGMALVAPHIKLGTGEADALYHAEDVVGAPYVIACEAKGEGEVLDEEQIERVALAVQAAPGTAGAAVIPVGIKKVYPPSAGGAQGLIWIRAYNTTFPPLAQISEGVYRLVPPVPGIE
jgi:hypothetical protein